MADKIEHAAEEVFGGIGKLVSALDAEADEKDFAPRAVQAVFKGAGSLGDLPRMSPDLWVLLLKIAIMVMQYILGKLEGKNPP